MSSILSFMHAGLPKPSSQWQKQDSQHQQVGNPGIVNRSEAVRPYSTSV